VRKRKMMMRLKLMSTLTTKAEVRTDQLKMMMMMLITMLYWLAKHHAVVVVRFGGEKSRRCLGWEHR
jgi:hypothetical protein